MGKALQTSGSAAASPMRALDLRLTLFSITIFVRLFCQYGNDFYILMLAANTKRHGFSVSVKSFPRWKLNISIPNWRKEFAWGFIEKREMGAR